MIVTGSRIVEVRNNILAFDDGEFKEGEHPRDKGGKFTAGGGGGGGPKQSVSPHNEVPVSNHLKKVINSAGFKKLKGQGKTTYVHPSGVKITIHPSPGTHHSSKWSLHKAGEETSGEGTSLSKALQKALGQAPQPATPVPAQSKNPSQEAWMGAASKGDFEFVDEDSGDLMFMGEGGSKLTVNSETGEWSIDNEEGKAIADGDDFQAFEKHVNPSAPVAPALAPLTGQSPLDIAKQYGSGKAIMALGYEPAEANASGTILIYQKPNGAKIKYDSTTTEWVAITPNHLTKEGTGLPALESLMKGTIAPGVKNSQQTIQTAAETSQQTQAKQAALEKAAKANAKNAEFNKVMNNLTKVAPVPTPAQRAAISAYSGSDYSGINSELRHNPDQAQNNAKVKEIDAYLKTATIPEAVTLYRKVKGDYAKILKSSMMEGCSFVDRGFISTSTHSDTWSGEVQMTISVPAGSNGAAIKSVSHHPTENEVLLPRNSILKVTKMDFAKGIIEVTLEQGHLK